MKFGQKKTITKKDMDRQIKNMGIQIFFLNKK